MKDATISELYDLTQTIAAKIFEGKTYPWEVLPLIKDFILELGETLDPAEYEKRGENIWIAKDASIAPTASINGPCIIGKGAEIRQCAFIRGNAIVGEGAVVGNSTELKNVILFNKVQVPHYNYVGDSVLGYKAHMGAGSITSNVKSDKKLVVVKGADEQIETGLKKFGAMLGDEVEVGCNSVLNPGTHFRFPPPSVWLQDTVPVLSDIPLRSMLHPLRSPALPVSHRNRPPDIPAPYAGCRPAFSLPHILPPLSGSYCRQGTPHRFPYTATGTAFCSEYCGTAETGSRRR